MTENMAQDLLNEKLQEEIEDRMSEDIITGKIKRGNKVIISLRKTNKFH